MSIYKKRINLVRENTFPYDLLIIDGQGRSGKNLISVVLSTMPRIEGMRIDTLLDYVPRYYSLGKMSHDAAVASLKIEMDEKLYNSMISRNINFRFSDYSSVFNNGKRMLYIKRLFQKPEEHAVERMKKEKPIFQNMTHDGLHLIRLYFDAFGERLKFIHVFRDPVENIYEQGRRGFGERIGTDPREFQLAYNWEGETIPLNAIGMEQDYINGNPTERLVIMVDRLLRLNIDSYLELDERFKKNVVLLEFEEFVVDPWTHVERLENFLGTKRVGRTKRIMKRERCPREPHTEQRAKNISIIEKNISPKYLEVFRNMIAYYDTKPWSVDHTPA
jgi:hypothetical protein